MVKVKGQSSRSRPEVKANFQKTRPQGSMYVKVQKTRCQSSRLMLNFQGQVSKAAGLRSKFKVKAGGQCSRSKFKFNAGGQGSQGQG